MQFARPYRNITLPSYHFHGLFNIFRTFLVNPIFFSYCTCALSADKHLDGIQFNFSLCCFLETLLSVVRVLGDRRSCSKGNGQHGTWPIVFGISSLHNLVTFRWAPNVHFDTRLIVMRSSKYHGSHSGKCQPCASSSPSCSPGHDGSIKFLT